MSAQKKNLSDENFKALVALTRPEGWLPCWNLVSAEKNFRLLEMALGEDRKALLAAITQMAAVPRHDVFKHIFTLSIGNDELMTAVLDGFRAHEQTCKRGGNSQGFHEKKEFLRNYAITEMRRKIAQEKDVPADAAPDGPAAPHTAAIRNFPRVAKPANKP